MKMAVYLFILGGGGGALVVSDVWTPQYPSDCVSVHIVSQVSSLFSIINIPIDEAISIAHIEPFHSSLHTCRCNR